MPCHRGHLHGSRASVPRPGRGNGASAVPVDGSAAAAVVDANAAAVPVGAMSAPTDRPQRGPDGHPPTLPHGGPAVLRDASTRLGGAAGGGGPSRLLVGLGVALASSAAAAIARRVVHGPMRSTPPVPARLPHKLTFGKVDGENRGEAPMDPPRTTVDELYWLRDDARTDKEVIAHLKAENAFTNYVTRDQRGLRKRIYTEMLSHVQQTDSTAPAKLGGYLYYSRTVEGRPYEYYCRRRIVGLDVDGTVAGVAVPDDGRVTWGDDQLGDEEVFLDTNWLAKGAKHFDVRSAQPSPDHTYVAYTVDVTGGETYELRVRHIGTGVERAVDTVKETSGSFAWGLDSGTIFYGSLDEAHRQHKVWRRTFTARDTTAAAANTASEAVDECLWTEDDEVFSAFLSKSLSHRFLFFGSGSSETSEVHFLDLEADAAARAAGTPPPASVLVEPRRKGTLYDVTHAGGESLLVVTNAGGATNFKLQATTVGAPGAASWVDVLPYDPAVKVDSVECFERFAVLLLRTGGFTRLCVMDVAEGNGGTTRILDAAGRKVLDFDEEAYVVSSAYDSEFRSRTFHFGYSSMTTPQQTWAYDGTTHERTLLKEKPVPAYQRDLYRTERWEATAEDGTTIPMSAVYRADLRAAEGVPQAVHLYVDDPRYFPLCLPSLFRFRSWLSWCFTSTHRIGC